MRTVLGIDLGTSSCRAVLVSIDGGRVVAEATSAYRHGENGVLLDPRRPALARQHPDDYAVALRRSVRECLAAASHAGRVDVAAIGVDTTGSTVLPLDHRLRPLTEQESFADNLDAHSWLWKDHTSHHEAAEIVDAARSTAPEVLRGNGDGYSAENMWAKVLHAKRVAPAVFRAAATWAELCDYVVGVLLLGIESADLLPRSIAAAAHKGLYSGGPTTEILSSIDADLADLAAAVNRFPASIYDIAGVLPGGIAEDLGLAPGTPVAVGNLDAHAAAIGAGVSDTVLAKVMGTSGCDLATLQTTDFPEVRGACGIGWDSLLPDRYGIEFGQPAVGDLFGWGARTLRTNDISELSERAARVPAGANGVMGIDWFNGNRSTEGNPHLTGVLVGLTLESRPDEIFRALLESVAFGSRRIREHLLAAAPRATGVHLTGGIPFRSPAMVQILADVLGCEVSRTETEHGTAVGAAITAAVASGIIPTASEAQERFGRMEAHPFTPDGHRAAVYADLYGFWTELHDTLVPPASTRPPVQERLRRRILERGKQDTTEWIG